VLAAVEQCVSAFYRMRRPRRAASVTASVLLAAPSLGMMDATWN
jgi:hypothetical protein